MGTRRDLRFETGSLIVMFGDMRLIAGVGQHQLVLPLCHSASWLEQESNTSSAVLISARVYAVNTGMRWLGEAASRIVGARGFELSDDLVLSVSDSQLLALDADRRGDSLRLTVDIRATLLQAAPGIHAVATTQVDLSMQSETWLRNLDQIGTELGITIRVPSPLTDPGAGPPPSGLGDATVGSRAQVAARLRRARSEIADGQYENSVAICRLALDGLRLLIPPTPSATSVKPRDRTQAQRWAALNEDLYSLLSGAHHDDSLTRVFSWTRADAEAVLGIVSSLAMRSWSDG